MSVRHIWPSGRPKKKYSALRKLIKKLKPTRKGFLVDKRPVEAEYQQENS